VRAVVHSITPCITTGALQAAAAIKLLAGETNKVGLASACQAFGHRYLPGLLEQRGLARARDPALIRVCGNPIDGPAARSETSLRCDQRPRQRVTSRGRLASSGELSHAPCRRARIGATATEGDRNMPGALVLVPALSHFLLPTEVVARPALQRRAASV
jgi:hypothetical protein